MFSVTIQITDIPVSYGNTVTKDKRKSMILDFYCLRATGVFYSILFYNKQSNWEEY